MIQNYLLLFSKTNKHDIHISRKIKCGGLPSAHIEKKILSSNYGELLVALAVCNP